MIMPEWIFLSLLAPLVWSISLIMQKLALARYNPPFYLILVLDGITCLMFAATLYAVLPFTLPPPTSLMLCGVIGLCYGLSAVFFYLAVRRNDITIISALWQITPIMVILMGYFFLREPMTAQQWVGSALAIIASVLLSLDLRLHKKAFALKNIRLNSSLLWMISAATAVAIAAPARKLALNGSDPNSVYIALRVISGLIFLLLAVGAIWLSTRRYRSIRLRERVIITNWRMIPLGFFVLFGVSCFIDYTATLMGTWAYKTGPISLISVIGCTLPLYSLILVEITHLVSPKLIPHSGFSKEYIYKAPAIILMLVGVGLVVL